MLREEQQSLFYSMLEMHDGFLLRIENGCIIEFYKRTFGGYSSMEGRKTFDDVFKRIACMDNPSFKIFNKQGVECKQWKEKAKAENGK